MKKKNTRILALLSLVLCTALMLFACGGKETYTVTLPAGQVGYTVTAQEGSVSPVESGGSFSFMVALDGAYSDSVITVKANGAVLTPVAGIYTISGISADQTVTVSGVVLNETESESFTVTFRDKDGAVIGTAQTIKHGEPAVVPNAPSVSGFDFSGWFTAQTGGTQVSDFSSITGNVTVYARYSVKTYTVTLNTDAAGGNAFTGMPSDLSDYTDIQHNDTVTLPVLSGYMHEGRLFPFLGWFTESEGGAQLTGEIQITANRTVYARWTDAEIFTVTFDTKDGNSPFTLSVFDGVNGNKVSEPEDPDPRIEYSFIGWFVSADGGATLGAGFDFDTAVTGNMTLYAKWQIKTFAVVFYDKDGGVLETQTIDYDDDATAPAPPAAGTGFVFDGWYDALTGGNKITGFDGVTANINAYARYKTATYLVVFCKEDGDQFVTREVGYGGDADVPAPPAASAGYEFDGWYSAKTGGSKVTGFTGITDNMTVYARYKAVSATVYFDLGYDIGDGTTLLLGEGGNPFTIEVTNGSQYGSLPVPGNREMLVFAGWWSGIGGTGTQILSDTVASGISGSATVYAKWQHELLVFEAVTGGYGVKAAADFGSKGDINLVIPSEWNGQPVVEILQSAFREQMNLITVTIPTSIIYIRNSAFYWCYNLEEITFADIMNSQLTNIGVTAFQTMQGSSGGKLSGTVYVPPRVDQIQNAIWFGNEKIDAIEFLGAVPPSTIENRIFNGLRKNQGGLNSGDPVVIYVPQGSLAAYEAAIPNNGNFSNSAGTGNTNKRQSCVLSGKSDFYTVTFMDKDGAIIGEEQAVVHGAAAVVPDAPAVTGYDFTGWFTAQAGGTQVTDFSRITKIISVYARYSVKTYTVILNVDAAGGNTFSGMPSDLADYTNIQHNDTVTLPVLGGYTHEGRLHPFLGWFTESEGGTQLTGGIQITDNRTVYARWVDADVFTVTFDLMYGGNTFAVAVFDGSDGNKVSEPEEPAPRAEYDFLGWFVSADGGATLGAGFDFDTAVTGDMTLYAKWQIKTFAVVFYDKDGGVIETQSIDYGGNATAPNPPTAETGFAFDGWYDALTDGNKISGFANITANMHVYARYKAEASVYTVVFRKENGEEIVTREVSYGGDAEVPAPPAAAAGYEFDGWYDAQTGGNKVTGFTNITDDMTVYARYKALGVSVSFDLGYDAGEGTTFLLGEGGALFTIQAANGSLYGELPVPENRNMYLFAGWWSGIGGTGTQILSDTEAAGITGDLTLYAKWEYTLAFEAVTGGYGVKAGANFGSLVSVDLIIPSEWNGQPVVEILQGAFTDFTNIVSVTIPTSIVFIRNSVFLGCRNIEEIIFTDIMDSQLTHIGVTAFQTMRGASGGKLSGTVYVPPRVARMENGIWFGNENIDAVEFLGAVPPSYIENRVFNGLRKNQGGLNSGDPVVIYVPQGSLAVYGAAIPNSGNFNNGSGTGNTNKRQSCILSEREA